MAYVILADLVAIAHAAYVAFVVVGLALIVAGAARGWEWVRDLRFRAAHLLAIAFVIAETVFGIPCPLTVLENHLRQMGGAAAYEGDFIARWVDWLIFYNLPSWVFTLAYFATAAAIAALFIIAPPRRSRRKPIRSTRRAQHQ